MSEKPVWRRIDPPDWAPPVGYANAVESLPGRRLSIAGQVAFGKDGRVQALGDLPGQARIAFSNVAMILRLAGARPEHVVRMRIYVTDVDGWRANSKAIGAAWRDHFGRWFPAMTLVGVARLYDPGALVEVEAEAVVPG